MKLKISKFFLKNNKQTKNKQQGWASGLIQLGGGANFVQNAWRQLYENHMQKISVDGVQNVKIVPLYNVLDKTKPKKGDYVAQVEPSPLGGKKIANVFIDLILGEKKSARFESV